MISHKYIDDYIGMYERGEIILNNERILLIKYLREHVLNRDDLYFNEEQIENYVRFTEKQYFILDEFQKFIVPFIFLYFIEDDELFYEQFFITMARGAGKNGFITSLSHYFISPMHGIPNYDVSVVANSEDQSKVSFKEMYECIQKNSLEDWFTLTKMAITSVDTNSVFRFRTSNASTKDGGRDGCVIYDEIHIMENADIVNVFSSGLGKIKNPREFFITTDGFCRDGYLDKIKERSMAILEGREPDDRLFPFICKLDTIEDMDNPDMMWQKANPMFHPPMNDYAKRLFNKVFTQYKQLETNPSAREEFVTKRMNLPLVDLEKSVALWEEIEATNQEIPSLDGRECIACIDFASIRDFASVGLLFRYKRKYVFLTHSFARKETVDKYYGYSIRGDDVKKRRFAPIREWEEQGLLTIVDEPSISPDLIVDWLVKARELYEVKCVVADNFRLELLRKPLEDKDFEVEIIRNPRAIHSLLAPRIETAFANREIIFGNNGLMRWYTNNVLVRIDKHGNKTYEKKEPIRRKTDGFQAFVHGMYRADEISEMSLDDSLDLLGSLNF